MWEGGSSCHKVRKLGDLIDCRSKDVSAWTYDIHPLRVNEVFYSGNVSVRRGSIMKRLAGTVLGLLLSQVCCELGLTHWGI